MKSENQNKRRTNGLPFTIKMQEMNKMGYNFNVPCSPESDFFKKIRV